MSIAAPTLSRVTALSLLLGFPLGASFAQTVLVNWNHSWSYMHPMGALPDRPAGGADTDFTTTWFLGQNDFIAQYDGPTFGAAPAQVGNPTVLTSYDSGSGPGPLGYGAIDYFASAGAEFTAFGSALTSPANNSRYTGYFRTTFTVPPQGAATPQVRYIMDDGAFVYLDGQLVATINIATNVLDTYTSFAANTTGTEAAPVRVLDLSTTGAQSNGRVLVAVPTLSPGTHTLAVSARSNAATSTDLCMALQVRASTTCAIQTAVTNVIRNDNGTPFNNGDDSITFTATVTGQFTGAGWVCAELPGSGAYGTPTVIGPVSIPASGPVTIRFSDAQDAGCFADAVVTPPGCSMTAIAGGFSHLDGGTPTDPSDDQYTASVTATAQFGGSGWTSATAPNSGAYGTPTVFGPFAAIGAATTITFVDNFTNTCTSAITLHGPRLMGTSTVAGTVPRLIMDGAVGENGTWIVATNLVTSMNNSGNTNIKTRVTRPFDLSAVSGLVRVRAHLVVTDTSTGSNFETEDKLRIRLEAFDGVSTTSTVLTDALDANGDGFINGYSGANYDANRALDEFNVGLLPQAATFTVTVPLQAILPDAVQSFRLILEGANNSGSETFTLQNVLVDTPFCEITARPEGAVVFNNQGDNNPANDTFSQPWRVVPVYVGSSTGWTSDATPAAGNYADAQPVTFGPFLVSGGARSINLDAGPGSGGCSTNFVVNLPPACSFTATPGVVAVQENGPGLADDTFTISTTLASANGGIGWISNSTPASGLYGPVTFGPFPRSGGAVTVTIQDAAYPATCGGTVSGTPPARYVLGTVSLGASTYDLGSDPNFAPPAQWVNNAAQKVITMSNAGGVRTVESQWVDLTSVTGAVNFNAVFTAWDTSAGSNFETPDTFDAYLLAVQGGVTNIVDLIASYDGNANGILQGYTGVTNAIHNTTLANYNANKALDEFNLQSENGEISITNNFPLAASFTNTASRIKLVVVGAGISGSEFFRVWQVNISTAIVDTDSDGMDDNWERQYFNNSLAEGAVGDFDSDGSGNYDEFIAGTLPNNAGSRLFTLPPAVTGGNFSLTWDSVPGKRYQVVFTPVPLMPGSVWQNVGAVTQASGNTTTFNGTLPSGVAGYLRVQVVP